MAAAVRGRGPLPVLGGGATLFLQAQKVRCRRWDGATGSWERCLFCEEECPGMGRASWGACCGGCCAGGVRYRSLGAVPLFCCVWRRRGAATGPWGRCPWLSAGTRAGRSTRSVGNLHCAVAPQGSAVGGAAAGPFASVWGVFVRSHWFATYCRLLAHVQQCCWFLPGCDHTGCGSECSYCSIGRELGPSPSNLYPAVEGGGAACRAVGVRAAVGALVDAAKPERSSRPWK